MASRSGPSAGGAPSARHDQPVPGGRLIESGGPPVVGFRSWTSVYRSVTSARWTWSHWPRRSWRRTKRPGTRTYSDSGTTRFTSRRARSCSLFAEVEDWPAVEVSEAAGLGPAFCRWRCRSCTRSSGSWYPPGGTIIRAMAAKLLAGGRILPHRDSHPSFGAGHRIHVPIATNPRVRFMIDGRPYQLEVGQAYEINNQKTHSVMNKGARPTASTSSSTTCRRRPNRAAGVSRGHASARRASLTGCRQAASPVLVAPVAVADRLDHGRSARRGDVRSCASDRPTGRRSAGAPAPSSACARAGRSRRSAGRHRPRAVRRTRAAGAPRSRKVGDDFLVLHGEHACPAAPAAQ